MPQVRTVLFAGFGYVAEATAGRLAAQGWRVIASARNDVTADAIARLGFEAVRADPSEPAGARALCAAAAQAALIVLSAPPGPAGDPFAAALSGVEAGAARQIYLSTTGVYGDRKGGWAFETDPPTPGQPRSAARVAAEQVWAARGALLFRLGGIYGPGRSPLDRLRAGDRTVFDKPGQVFSRIHVADIAAAIALAAGRPEAQGAFNLVDDHPSSQAETYRGAARLLGLPEPEVRAFDPAAASPMLASFYAECRRVSNARAKAALGWRPTYPSWREGLSAILQAGG